MDFQLFYIHLFCVHIAVYEACGPWPHAAVGGQCSPSTMQGLGMSQPPGLAASTFPHSLGLGSLLLVFFLKCFLITVVSLTL